MTAVLRLGPRLNLQLIVPVVGGAVLAVGLGLLICVIAALAGRGGGVAAFGAPGVICVVLGAAGVASGRRLRSMPLRARDGFLAVTLAWLAAAVLGAVPFLLHGTFDRPVEAFFESMSGFTTTGATLLDEIEPEPDAVKLWRSMSQWLGGVGIVVLVVAIAPATGLASQRVFYAETSGVTTDRLTPRIADTAKIIWGIYLAFTATGFVAFLLAGMGPFDAVNHVLTSIATGGFSTRTASIGAFDSVAIELVAIGLMVLGAINFAFYWRALRGGDLRPQLAEIRVFLTILVVAIGAATLTLVASQQATSTPEALRGAAFSVVSIVTSTGYTTVDFDGWPDFGRLMLLVLMFVGGCAGSTSGGMKVIRVMLLGKSAAQEVQRQLQPKAVQVLRVRGKTFSEDVRRSVFGFFMIYVSVTVFGALVMAALGLDMLTAVSSSISAVNIIGPAMGDLGAAENFAVVPEAGLWFLSALMLIGRLEVFTVLVLLTPAFWRPNVA